MFIDFFKKLGFHNTKADYSLFVSLDKTIFIAIYVNDLFLFNNNGNTRIVNAMHNLQNWFKITDFGNISYYFGMKIDVDLS